MKLDYKVILASKSPRRQQLLSDMGVTFETKLMEVDEVYPSTLPASEVAEFLANLKAEPFMDTIADDELVITSDTVVCVDDEVLGKPADKAEAIEMLQKLSGKAHEVISGVCLSTADKQVSFSSSTVVYFKELTDEEITYYVDNYKPFDKAGSYGIQEWIGYIGITSIEGSYFNVMGLPVQKLYEVLSNF